MTTNEQALSSAVEHLYAIFGRYGPLKSLEACMCGACMSCEAHEQILSTPVRAIPSDVLAQYTDDAGGVPEATEELKILLPRYLDLLASGCEPDLCGTGTVLMRFGDAVRTDSGFYTEEEFAALMVWMWAFVARFGEVDADGAPGFDGDVGIAKIPCILICGGFPAQEVVAAMTSSLLADGFGPAATVAFVEELASDLRAAGSRAGLDWFALRYARKEDRACVTAWLNQPWWSDHLASIETPSDLDHWDKAGFERARAAFGSFDERLFDQPSWFGVAGQGRVKSVRFPPDWDTQFDHDCYRATPTVGDGWIELHFIERVGGLAIEEDGTLERLVGAPLPTKAQRIPRSLFGAGGFVAEWKDGETWRLVHVAEHAGGAIVSSAAHRGEGLEQARPSYQACAHMHRLAGGRSAGVVPAASPPFPATVVSELDGERICADRASLDVLLAELRVHQLQELNWVVFDRTGALWKTG